MNCTSGNVLAQFNVIKRSYTQLVNKFLSSYGTSNFKITCIEPACEPYFKPAELRLRLKTNFNIIIYVRLWPDVITDLFPSNFQN
jgi:hypothetical protein